MKILITLHPVADQGGILNHTEGLISGFHALGHEVFLKLLEWKVSIRSASSSRALASEPSVLGIPYDQARGYYWPQEMRFAYKGAHNLADWKDYANRFDLIIHQIAVPTKQKDNAGNLDWLELYDVSTPQLAMVHDGNLADGYPWICLIADKLRGAVGVHPCAYNALARVPVRRAMIFNPQSNVKERLASAHAYKVPRSGWFSLQTFKGWKHVEDIVRAVPYMRDYPKTLAGGGINYYYMTSKDKVKEQFLASKRYDPDLPKRNEGKRIWDIALKAGMEYCGYVTNAQREERLHNAKFLIDPSWSRKYSQTGDHFNRVVIDGIIGGCVPIARNLGISTNLDGNGEIFQPDHNYLMIPYDATPTEFAACVDAAMAMNHRERNNILEAGRHELLPKFVDTYVAEQFIAFAKGKGGPRGKAAANIMDAANHELHTFFTP